jgi:hypothetical protein
MKPSLWLGLALLLGLTAPAEAEVIFSTNAPWKLFKGRSEASTPDTTAWRTIGFDDAAWTPAPAPFWYGDVLPGGTQLTDMLNQYTCLFLRRTFVVTNLADFSTLRLGARCDDGFIAWINGVEVRRYNVPSGNLAYNRTASGAVAEPPPFTITELTNAAPASYLVPGTNVIAVQAFNASLGSSDLGIDVALYNDAPDTTAPAVAGVIPQAGLIGSLTQITVVFSEPVLGVNAADLLINGVAATAVTGGSEQHTFTFPQPAYGTVNVTWAGAHGITDEASPPHPFNATAQGATWSYTLADISPPLVVNLIPFSGAVVRSLGQIEVVFSEAVTGVDAGDLLINNQPATNVSAVSAADYIFRFPQPPTGVVQVAWRTNHAIRDLAAAPNNFAGGSWSYTLDPDAPIPSVRINELLAANVNGLRDEDNEPQDWVELFNTTSNAVNLAGWSLTDDADEEDKWVFPAVTIGARAFLVVFCSGKDRKPTAPGSRLHTNFKLNPDGEYLALLNNEAPRVVVSVFAPYPNQRRDYSYGYDTNEQLRYFQTPSPGSNNPASTITGVVADTKFSHDRGFYDTNFNLALSCATTGAVIRFTLDGKAPTETTGTVYTNPIPINRTTVVRAAAYRTGLLPSDVDAHTYLFLNDVIIQATNGVAPAGWPASWSPNATDYGMDPDIVTAAPWKDTLKDDLKSIPTFSIVMSLDDLFGATGIYSNPGGDTIAWERPCSVELIYPDDTEGFQANCGIRIRGGFSRSTGNPKHAFRFFFRQEYGPSKLNYPFFGPTGASSFDKFDLRTMQNYSWSFGGDSRMICLRDVMSRDAQLAMNGLGTRGNFYHLYVNGLYWGLFNSEERPEASFAESYVGGREEDYDVIKQLDGYTSGATDGNTAAWYRLWEAATNGFASDSNYFRVQGLNVDGTVNTNYENLVDVPNLIDYMLVILYGGNLDAPISNFLGNDSPNNWYGFRDRTGKNGGFRFISHDAEHTLLNVNEDRTGIIDLANTSPPNTYGVINPDWTCGNPLTQSGGVSAARQRSTPQYIWFRMHENAEFRMLAADRIHKHCFTGGPLSVEGMRAMFLARSNEIQRAIVAESARWGDAHSSRTTAPLTRNNWVTAMNTAMGFINGRTAVLLNQLRADGLYPNAAAPTFSSYGGIVAPGFRLYLTNSNGSGTIYYTVNGADPRVRGGGVSPSALAYVVNNPVVINFNTVVKARALVGTVWSALVEATFYTIQDYRGLLVTEIMYHPPDNGLVTGDNYEFLELKNTGTNTLDLGGASFTDGINFTFTNGTRLAPGQFFVLGRNRGELQNKYPGLAVHGVYTGRLDNSGEQLTLSHALGSTILSFSYGTGGRWPRTPDGHGYSLVPRSPNANPDPGSPANWRASTQRGGSPGADDPAPVIAPIVVNEALTHTDPPLRDAIELHNPTGTNVAVGGWFLTDDGNTPFKFRIPDGTTIAAGGYLVFTESDFNGGPDTNRNFLLSSTGDEVYLFSADAATNPTGYSHGFSFGAAANGVSFGRHVTSAGDEHFVAQMARTLPGANSGPRVGPVVFRQIHYHPPDLPGGLDDQDNEYLLLQNITGAAVPLFDPAAPANTWRLRDAVDFDFPANVTLPANGTALVVSFSPTNASQLAAFYSKYGNFGGAPIFGPYSGKLDNSADTLELERPDSPNSNGVPYVLVERVSYRDTAPWPPGADGSGAVLQRVTLTAYGNDPGNWVSAAALQIITQPTNRTVSPGTNVTFVVLATGTGTLRYQWQRDGRNIPGATTDTLALTNVQITDQGVYRVIVTDNTGSITSAGALLNVLSRPIITMQPQSVTVARGEDVTLSIAALGTWPLSYSWRSNTTSAIVTNIILNDNLCFYTIRNVQTNFVFRVGITNILGTATNGLSSNAVVTVLLDTDGDKLPDDWENAYSLNPTNNADATVDSDGDTMTNWEEYVAGTDPQDAQSYLWVQADGLDPDGARRVSFPATSNKTYTVLCSEAVTGPWLHLVDVPAAPTNRTVNVTNTVTGSLPRYYRLTTPRMPPP